MPFGRRILREKKTISALMRERVRDVMFMLFLNRS